MKRIIITGKNSYIGKSVKRWLESMPNEYQVDETDVRNGVWKDVNFGFYNSIFHVAGIAHQRHVDDGTYLAINYELAVDVLKKAIDDKVEQFIFMSSGAVYSQSDRKHDHIVVDESSPMQPNTMYGKSKMLAEKDMYRIAENSSTKLVILRPPTVYGYNAKGNYKLLSAMAQKTFLFPKVDNRRSMIYIENLCEFIRLIIDSGAEGCFLPQNREYVNTSTLVKTIGEVHGKKIKLNMAFNGIIRFFGNFFDVINKIFGTYYYEKHGEEYFEGRYQVVDFVSSIYKSENIRQTIT